MSRPPAESSAVPPATAGAPPTNLEALADDLWSVRHLLERLLFKLVAAKLLLSTGECRFVASALDEVDRVGTVLRGAEIKRAATVEAVATTWKVPPDALTLHELAARAPAPMDAVFDDHRDALASITAEIGDTAAACQRLAAAARGTRAETGGAEARLEQELRDIALQATLRALGEPLPRSLRAFLR